MLLNITSEHQKIEQNDPFVFPYPQKPLELICISRRILKNHLDLIKPDSE